VLGVPEALAAFEKVVVDHKACRPPPQEDVTTTIRQPSGSLGVSSDWRQQQRKRGEEVKK